MTQAVIWRLLGNNGDRTEFTVADASAIAKGDFLELADANLVTAHGGNVDTPIVGIAAAEKVANDGHTSITGITNCEFKATLKASTGACTIGDFVSMGNAAGVVDASSTLDFEKGWVVGRAREAGGAAETALFRSMF